MADGILIKFGYKDAGTPAAEMIRVTSALREGWDAQVGTVKGVLREYLESVAEELARKHGTQWPGGTSDNTLSKRSGRGVTSIIKSVKVKGTTWETLSGSVGGRKYLGIHEYGGTIKPKRVRFLTIPLPDALGPRGTSPPFARQWKNTFVKKTRRGHLLVYQTRGKGQVVPLYILVDKVRIPPRLGLRDEMQKQLPYFLDRAADRVVADFDKRIRK